MGGIWDQLMLAVLWAAQPSQPVLERLDPRRRTAVIMAIIGMLVIGFLLVTCTMLGARWVRRIARQKPRPSRMAISPPSQEEIENSRASLDGVLPQVDPDETIHSDRPKGETKIDP